MLPRRVQIESGTTVRWVTLARVDPHTVTFGDDSKIRSLRLGEPAPPLCDARHQRTTPRCAGLLGYFPFRQAPRAITNPSAFATSGVIATERVWHPLGRATTFSFPQAGTFLYQCKVHDHMDGSVRVVPAPNLKR
jgi:plastocyanin